MIGSVEGGMSRVSRSFGFFAISFLGLTTLARSVHAAIEWRGTIVRAGTATFALTDTATGTSKWVPMGGAFGPFTVSSYDGQRQVLVLTKDGVRTQLTVASSTPVTATSKPAANELSSLSGLPLAEALAKRGDTTLRDLLTQLRAAQVSREELNRRVAEAERLVETMPANAPKRAPIPGQANGPGLEAVRDDLRTEAQRADDEITRLTAQIEKMAMDRRAAAIASP